MKSLVSGFSRLFLAHSVRAVAIALVTLTAVRAWNQFDIAWDSLAYHMPFIAFRMGFMTPAQFEVGPYLQAYYDGFPAALDVLRGGLWIVFRRVEAVNLLNVMSLVTLSLYVWRRFGVPIEWSVVALFAIPTLQTMASTTLTDIVSNAVLMIVILSIVEVWVDVDRVRSPSWWSVFFCAAFLAANSKPQIAALTILALAFAVIPVLRGVRRHVRRKAQWAVCGLLISAGLAVIGYNFIKNAIVFNNPLYPVGIKFGPINLPGGNVAIEDPPRYLADAPRFLRWLLSVIEYRSLDNRAIPYTLGMGDVPATSPSARMGGFFGFLSVFSAALFIYLACRVKDRLSLTLLAAFLILTAVVANLPGSYESRYYSAWMMLLVLGTQIVAARLPSTDALSFYRLTLMASLVFVVSVTGANFFDISRSRLRDHLRSLDVVSKLQRSLVVNRRICINDGRLRFLFAPVFHRTLAREQPYAVTLSCDGALEIPLP